MYLFKLVFSTRNDAFGATPAERNAEIAATLRKLADEIEMQSATKQFSRAIRDRNGNTIGCCSMGYR